MSGASSEEKNHPASRKKLQDARKKGQVAKSRDLVGALTLTAAAMVLAGQAGSLTERLRDAMRQALRLQNAPFAEALPQVAANLADLAAITLLPLLGLIFAMVVLASVLATQGVVVSLDPLKPKFSKLNPIKGLAGLFAAKALVELGKGLLKALILGAALFTIILETVRSLPLLPACGVPCLGSLIAANAKSLLQTTAGISLAAGLADVLIQRWLFLRDMKMSKSEVKKEHKDQEGDPHVRNAHRRHRQEAASLPRTGLDRATILIRGRGVVVGMRYVASEGTAPVIVCRARDERADAMLAAGAALRIPTVADEWLAVSLAKKVPPGTILPNRFFDRAAQAIYATMQT